MDLPAHREVQPVAVLAQVGDGGADPDAAQVVGGGHPDSGRIGAVGVLDKREPLPDAGLPEGPLNRRLGVGLTAPYRDRTFSPVEVVVDVQVVFHPAEERQHLGVGPLIVAEGGPVVVVLGEPALHGLPVDGGAAADDLALGHVYLALLLGGHAPEGPVVLRLGRLGVTGVSVLHFVWDQVEVRVVPARFQQQHRPVRVLRQPAGQDGARGPSPDNDHVVFHASSIDSSMVSRVQTARDLTTSEGLPSTGPERGCRVF